MEDSTESTYFIPLISDYGFKISFATDSIFTRKAIQTLIESKVPIEHLEMLRNEFERITLDSRSGLYDVVCRDEHSRVFIIEMQVDNYLHFIQRLLFYVFHMYCSQVQKGKTGFKNLPPIYCVCIIEGQITEYGNYYNKVTFQNQQGLLFTDNVEFHLVELGKFPILREDFNKIDTDMEKLVYTLKYAHQFEAKDEANKPSFWKEEWMEEILQKVDINRMSPEQRVMYDMSKVKLDMYYEKLDEVAAEAAATATLKATAEANALALQKAEEKSVRSVVSAHLKGIPTMDICEITELSIEKVLQIIDEYEKK